jgi:hypothetical protein
MMGARHSGFSEKPSVSALYIAELDRFEINIWGAVTKKSPEIAGT